MSDLKILASNLERVHCYEIKFIGPFSSPSPLRPLQNPSRKDLNVQMMMEIESALVTAEVIRSPCIYIRPEVDKATANKIKDIISNHQVEICGKFVS